MNRKIRGGQHFDLATVHWYSPSRLQRERLPHSYSPLPLIILFYHCSDFRSVHRTYYITSLYHLLLASTLCSNCWLAVVRLNYNTSVVACKCGRFLRENTEPTCVKADLILVAKQMSTILDSWYLIIYHLRFPFKCFT